MRRTTLASLFITLTAIGVSLAFAVTSVASSALPTLTLAVTPKTITVGGQMVSGAVRIATTVSGEKQDNPSLLLLKPGVTPQQFASVVSKLGNSTPVDAIDPYATIVYGSADAPAGKTTVGYANLAAGTYVALNNGSGHAVFTVTQSSAPAAMPRAAATVKAIDFGYRGADVLHEGEMVRWYNAGYLVHMMVYGRVASVAVAKKAEAMLLAGKEQQAEKLTLAHGTFVELLSSGQSQESVIDQPPGVYVILCLMNTQDGRLHSQLGMFRTIRIVG
jgi:hypothetical protein